MNPGETFDQDKIERFGDPWHGLYRGGVLELPNLTTRAMGGPDNGENYKIAIPGQAAVTTDPADAALGMTWLNYGVITGEAKSLYGNSLDNTNAWIWIDDAGVPWLATASKSLAAMTLTVTVKKFGEITGTPETYSDSVTLSSIYDLASVPYIELAIDDIDSAGRQVALVARVARTKSNTPLDWFPNGLKYRETFTFWLLTLSGTGAAMVLNLSSEYTPTSLLVQSFSAPIPLTFWKQDKSTLAITGPFTGPSDGEVDPTVSDLDDFDYCYSRTSGTITRLEEFPIGATLVNDSLAFVFRYENTSNNYVNSPDMSTLFQSGGGRDPDTLVGRWWWIMDEESDNDYSGYFGLRVDGTLTQWPMTKKEHMENGFVTPTGYGPDTIAGETVTPTAGTSSPSEMRVYQLIVQRLGNRAYGAAYHKFVPITYETPFQVLSVAAAGPVSGDVSPFWTSAQNPLFATAHHTTGALITSTSGVVCFM